MFVIPCLGIIAPAFIVLGIAAPVLGAVKMIDYIFNLNIPYMENIGISLGEMVTFNPVTEFIISLIVGVLICLAGRIAWKLLVLYCRKISKTAGRLSYEERE